MKYSSTCTTVNADVYVCSAIHVTFNNCMYFLLLLHVMFLVHVDVNECSLGTAGCDQLCTNNIGSYTCGCNVGYYLLDDGHSCTGSVFVCKSN